MKNLFLKAASTAMLTACCMSIAWAQAQLQTFNIPADDLGTALRSFARASKQQVVFDGGAVRGKRSADLVGSYAPEEAIRRLLASTDLVTRRTESGVLVIEPADKGAAARGGPGEPPRNPTLLALAQTQGGAGASEEKSRKAERIEVTGSRIPGAADGPSPVQTYTRKDIEDTGAGTIAEFLRKLPQNFNSAVPETAFFTATNASVGNSDQGFATSVNLRGMGADSTLILLNGRRLATSGGTGGAIVDISTIPLAAIERIEILTDGASAIYGADAIGGVVNIILRRQFDGAQVTARYGNDTTSRNTDEKLVNAVGGFSTDKARLMAGVDYFEKNPLFYADRALTRSLDRRAFGGRDLRSMFQAVPGNVRAVDNFLNALNRATSATNWVAIPSGQDGTRLTPAAFNPTAPANLGPEYFSGTLTPGEQRKSAFASADYWVSDNLRLFAEGLHSERSVKFRTSAPITTGLRVPANNPFNPLGEDVFVAYQFIREFPRGLPFERMNEAYLATAGAAGSFPTFARGYGWEWEVALTGARDDFEGNVVQFTTANANAAAALTDRARALNLFGDQGLNNPETITSLFRTFLVAGKNTFNSAFIKLDGDVFPAPGGRAKAAVGAELRKERSVFFTEITGNRFEGDRDVKAAFAELLVPFVKRGGFFERADLTVAGRAEDYSDFGRANSPKAGFVVASREALLRASWGKSFKAPLLREITSTGSLITTTLVDTNAPGGPVTVSVPVLSQAGNMRLSPEKADIWSVSGTWNLVSTARSKVSVEGSYFDIEFHDRIVNLSSTLIFGLERQGVLPSGVVNRDERGNLVNLSLSPLNFARLEISGLDARIAASQVTPVGSLSLVLAGTRYRHYRSQVLPGQPVLDVVGKIGWPVRWNANATLGWSWQGWSANLAVNGGASYLNDLDPVVPGRPDTIRGFTTVDLNAAYETSRGRAWWSGIRVGAGISNLLDEDAPHVQGLLGFDPSRANVRGRAYHVSVAKSF